MAPAVKEATVFILDVGSNVCQIDKANKKKDTFFERSCLCLNKILERKIFNKPKDEVGLVLIGTDDTNNMLSANLGGYKNISEAFCLAATSWQMLRMINSDVIPADSQADWLDGLIVAMDFMRDQTEAKKFTSKKIILFTNFATEVNSSNVEEVITGLKSMDIELIVIGSHVLSNFESGDQSDMGHVYFSQKIPKSEQQALGEKIITRIVNEVNGTMCNFDDAVTELTYFASKRVTPSPWYTNLTIGPDISIAVCGYKRISDDPCLPTWKIRTTLPNSSCVLQRDFFKQSEEGTAVDVDNLIKGYKYGATNVPFTAADQSVDYESGPRCLSVLGFTKLSNIHREWFAGKGVLYIIPRKDYTSSETAFAALVDALDQQKMVGIARRVYNNNNAPTINCLLPKITKKYKVLVLIQLPYFEDLHFLAFPPLIGKKIRPSEEQLKAVDSLIDSMDLMTATANEDGEPMEAYNMKRTVNPLTQYTYQSLAFRALYKNQELLPPSEDIMDLISVPVKLQEQSQPILKQLSQLFKLTEKEKPLSGREKWINNQLAKIGKAEPTPSTSAAEPAGDANIVPLARNVLVEVGTLQPAKDFELLIARGESFATVAKQIQNVITNLIMNSFSDDFEKPLEALKSLRLKSISEDTSLYNDWMIQFKDMLLSTNKNIFWNSIVQDRLGLITTKDAPLSTVSESTGEAFLRDDASASQEVGQGDAIDADDLFDEM